MATISSLIVNLSMNSASFESGAKRSRNVMFGIGRDVQQLKSTLDNATRFAARMFIGESMLSGIKAVMTQAQAAAKTAEGAQAFAKTFDVEPAKLGAAVDAFSKLQTSVKGMIVGGIAELAPALVGAVRGAQALADAFRSLAESTAGSLGNLLRIIASGYVFVKVCNLTIVAVNAVIKVYRAWAAAALILQGVTGAGLIKAAIGIVIAGAAVVGMNLAFDKLAGSVETVSENTKDLTGNQSDLLAVQKRLDEQTRRVDSITDGLGRRMAIAFNMARHGVSEVVAELMAMGATAKDIAQVQFAERMIAGLERVRERAKQLASITEGAGRRMAIAYNVAHHGVSEVVAELMAMGATAEDIAQVQFSERMIAGFERARKRTDWFADSLAALRDQINLFGASDLDKLLNQMVKLDFPIGSPEVNRIINLYDVLESQREAAKLQEQYAAGWAKWESAFAQVWESTKLPMDSFGDRLQMIDELFKFGWLDADRYGRAIRDAFGEYGSAARGRDPRAYQINPHTLVGGRDVLTIRQESPVGVLKSIARTLGLSNETQNRILKALEPTT